jgi:hypothetical protein
MSISMRLSNLTAALFALTLMPCCAGAQWEEKFLREHKELFSGDKALKLPFKVKDGQLILRCVSFELPMPPKLFLINPGVRIQRIDDLKQLRSHVIIQTPQGALAFVRLKTSKECYMFGPEQDSVQIEVTQRTPVSKKPAKSHESTEISEADFHEGFLGRISSRTAKRLGLSFAACVRSGSGFEVTRTLLVCPVNERHYNMERDRQYLERIVEWVGEDGEYRIIKRTVLNLPAGEGAGWVMPSTE